MTLAIYVIAFIAFFITGLNLLPTGTLSPEIATGFITIVQYMKAWSFLLPIDSLFTALLVVVVADLALLGWWIMKWLFDLMSPST